MAESNPVDRFIQKNYFVEECDCFTGHMDHDIVGWFDDFDEAKRFADQKAETAQYFHTYRVYGPPRDSEFWMLNSNCLYEAKGTK